MLISYLRAAFLYLVLILSIRLMGKRQIGQMEASEFVVTMLVANLAAIPMQDGAIPLYSGLVPILTVLGLELMLSWVILRSIKLRKLFCGKPVILMENGKMLQSNMRKTKVTLDELTGHLREKDVLVRHFDKPRLRDYNRITIGSREQMEAFIKKLKEVLEELT